MKGLVMGYTHYFTFNKVSGPKGTADKTEEKYQRAIVECQRIVKRYYRDNGGISGYTAHVKTGKYGGINVNGKGDDSGETFVLREHFRQNLESDFMGFCKTFRCPYDTVVTACLALLKYRLGDAITISSDGNALDWLAGVTLARMVTRRNIPNPMLTRDSILNIIQRLA